MKGALGNDSLILFIIFLSDWNSDPMQWSIWTTSIPYFKNFSVEFIKCVWTSLFV